jgi:parallel beta-helix repeat protein
MATRRPIVLVNGISSELPVGDDIDGALYQGQQVVAGSGLVGGGLFQTNPRVDVALAANPSGLYFTGNNKLGFDGHGDNIQVIASGVGAVYRTVESKLQDVVSIRDFGASPSNSTSANNAAFTAAFTALNSGQAKSLFIPAGQYQVSTTFTLTAHRTSIIGEGPRVSVINQTANVDTIVVTSATPDNADFEIGRINDVMLSNFGINQGNVTNPTGGTALTLRRPCRSQFKGIDIRNVFRGVLIEAAVDCHFSDSTITSYAWATEQANTFLVRIARYVGTTVSELSSELFFNSINWKGTSACTVQRGLIIESGDGIWFTNGHIGFAWRDSVALVAQDSPSASLINIYFSEIYFDGNLITNNAQGAVTIAGSNTPAVREILFNGCTFRNFANQHALHIDSKKIEGLTINSCIFVNNGRFGILASGASGNLLSGCVISDNYFFDNNKANASSNCIQLDRCSSTLVMNNNIIGGTSPHPWGIILNANATGVYVANNIISACTGTIANNAPSTCKVVDGYNPANLVPTLASASTISGFPLEYSVFQVSGTTTINTIDGATTNTGRIITLIFTGTAGVADGVGNLSLASNFTATANSTLTLVKTASGWSEVSRAIV